jgi:hypothetical protein
MINAIYNIKVQVKRRLDISVASRDTLNDPIYGTPTTNWSTVYSSMPARLAFSSKPLQFAPTAERITPNGVMYIPNSYQVYHEDRIITPDGIEYVVTSVIPGYLNNNILDHYELSVELP